MAWTYSAADHHFDFLAKDETLTITYAATVQDNNNAVATQNVVVTVTGTNDVASITGQDTGSVVEAGAGNNGGTPTANGNLSVVDADHDQSAFNPETNVATTYGHFTIGSGGTWSYTLDNNNPTVNALNTGQTLHDLITVSSLDGTTHQVDITINGTDDDIDGPDGVNLALDLFGAVNDAGQLKGGSVIGTFTAFGDTDPPAGDTNTVTLGAGSDNHFQINNGVLSVVTNTGTGPQSFDIFVVASDPFNHSITVPMTVWLGSDKSNLGDVISFAGGNAVIAFGMNGDDNIIGSSHDDVLVGGKNDDQLNGGAGKDILFGGEGNDTLTGGADSDQFVFTANFGHDTIVDFTHGEDHIVFDQAIFQTVSDILAHASQVGADTVITFDQSNSVTLKNVDKNNLSTTDFVIHS